MSRLRHFIFVLALFSTSVASAESPEEVAKAALAAQSERGYVAQVEFTHPDEILRFKTTALAFIRLNSPASEEIRRSVFGWNASVTDVEGMEPQEFMRRFLAGIDSRLKAANGKSGPGEVLGTVAEGELRHVVVRTAGTVGTAASASGVIKTSNVEVLTMRPFGDSWRFNLAAAVEGIAATMQGAARAQR